MSKLFSTKTHAALDYLSVALCYGVPRLCRWDETARALGTAGAVATLAYSGTTRYAGGAVRVLPMHTHLTLDALQGMTFLGAAAVLTKEPPVVRLAMAGYGLFALFASQATETRSPEEAVMS